MVRACKRFDGAPPPSGSARAGRKPFLKKDLLTHLRKTVVGLTCDAAADEVLSAEIMRNPNLANMRAAITPNLRCIIWDKAHASRRLISRPSNADDYS